MTAVNKLELRQSPINISQATAKFQDYRPFALIGHENLSISNGTLTPTNTGTTIKCLAKPGTALLEGGPLNVRYEFVEMHFHWGDCTNKTVVGSEHTIDNKAYPLELHMVHKNVHDATVGGALNHENGICVLGFLFTVVPDDSDLQTIGMDALCNIVGKHLQAPNSKFDQEALNNAGPTGDVNVANFVPLHLDEYFHYRGSLTTGGCEEAVNWVVFRTPVAVKEKHLKALQSIRNPQGANIVNNYRPTMPVNERPLYYKGERLMDLHVISRGSSVGLRSQQNAEVIDEDDLKNLKI